MQGNQQREIVIFIKYYDNNQMNFDSDAYLAVYNNFRVNKMPNIICMLFVRCLNYLAKFEFVSLVYYCLLCF